jgi:hypothetical protein
MRRTLTTGGVLVRVQHIWLPIRPCDTHTQASQVSGQTSRSPQPYQTLQNPIKTVSVRRAVPRGYGLPSRYACISSI